MHKASIVYFFLCFATTAFGQTKYLNLDFESKIYGTDLPKIWNLRGAAYNFSLDSVNLVSGKYSLRIERTGNGEKSVASLLNKLPAELLDCGKIRLVGSIRTEGVTDGFAGLIIRIDGNGKILSFDNMADRGITGTQIQNDVTIEMEIPPGAENIFIGAIFAGKGVVYLDSLSLFCSDQQFVDKPPVINYPEPEEIEWLSEQIIPLKTFLPSYFEVYEDLNVLRELLADAKIVGLGEASHGTKEFFLMKDRLMRFLVTEMGFDIFSMEANMIEAYDLNQYVINGENEPKELLGNLGFWTWNTTEVLAMINWMHQYNLSIKDSPLQFTGFDMQSNNRAYEELSSNLANEFAEQLSPIKSNLDSLELKTKNTEIRNELKYKLDTLKTTIRHMDYSEKTKSWLIQNVEIIDQSTRAYRFKLRDQFMAENVSWIYESNPGSKMVLWAHNGHVKNSGNAMGQYLKEKYGNQYVNIGFAFHSGEYSAKGNQGLGNYTAQKSHPGTYEFFFQKLNEPIFLLDLRKLENNSEASTWIFEEMDFRVVGARKLTNEFYPTEIIKDFDILIFIKESSPTELIKD